MAIRKVLMLGNPLLRKESGIVEDFGSTTKVIIDDLKDTLLHLQNVKHTSRAIAASQIGILKRMIYINIPARAFTMINPVISFKSSETIEVWDSCFSFDIAFFVKVQRYKSIRVDYLDEHGSRHSEIYNDDLSELFQHEIDHLHGILATDYLKNNQDLIMREEWEKFGRM